MLYIVDGIDLFGDNFNKQMELFLSEQRCDKIKKLRFVKSKNVSAASYLLLRIALRDLYSINEVLEFEFTEKGKPMLKKYPHIHFNLSHSGDIATCAVSNEDVGVDVQMVKPVKDSVAKRVLTAEEYAGFKNAMNPDEYFCEMWATKESYLKLTGQGISDELREISAEDIQDKMVYRGADYFCCVCGAGAETIQIKHIGRDDFEQLRNR